MRLRRRFQKVIHHPHEVGVVGGIVFFLFAGVSHVEA